MSNPSALDALVRIVGDALSPLANRLQGEQAEVTMEQLGLRLPLSDSGVLQELQSSAVACSQLPAAVAAVIDAAARGDDNALITAIKNLIELITRIGIAFAQLGSALDTVIQSDGSLSQTQKARLRGIVEKLPERLLNLALISYVEDRQPAVKGALELAGLFDDTLIIADPMDPSLSGHRFKQVRFDRIAPLFFNPEQYLKTLYGFGSPGFDGVELFRRIKQVVDRPDAEVLIIEAPGLPIALEAWQFRMEAVPGATPALRIRLRVPAQKDLDISEHLAGPWFGTVTSSARFESGIEFLLHPTQGLQIEPPPSAVSIDMALGIKAENTNHSPMILFGQINGSRVELQRFALRLPLKLIAARGVPSPFFTVGAAFELNQGKIVIDTSQLDGFLAKILPGNGLTIPFDLEGGWTVGRGLYFKGGAGFETTIPVNIDFLGVIKMDSVYLALEAKEDSKTKESAIRAVTATTVKVQLGPISAIVERFGLQATLSFPEKGGNLGVANLDLGFKPPNGVGIVIKAQVVTGGGYLYFDVEKEQYAGVLQLEIAQKFSLTAVGLLTTKMPDGSKGFSLLVIISVRFDPGIQLGYGFSLNGLGGLLGVNRTANTEALRDGLRRGALGSILFPQNVVENAPTIVSNLSEIFPPAKDRFLFGPMAIIGWGGSPPLLSMEIGIILELPDPFRLIILGRLRVTLPSQKDESTQASGAVARAEDKTQDTPKIKLQLDSLGIIDFGSGDISLDAFLYDSTIGPFTITGGMALRISFGAKPLFLLSVGGYHPAFQAPAGFPSVDRVSVGISKNQDGVTVRLQLSAYFALTSNTVQFGSHLDLYVHVSEFEIIGLLGFDVLIQFQPFRLIASFDAMVAVKAGSIRLMAVWLQVNLEGPSPWHAWGKAQFEILLIKQSAEFSVVTGQKQKSPPLPPPIDVKEVLRTELENPSNWTSHLPIGENPLVTFGQLENASPGTTPPPPSKQVLIHPLAELHINQRLVPLNAPPLDRYGHATPKEKTTFKLTIDAELEVLKQLAPVEYLTDWFARAQFYDMTDDAKLASPSFEQMDSGIRLKAKPGYSCGTPFPVEIEPASRGDQNNTIRAQLETSLPPSFLSRVAHLGAAGQAPIRASGPAKYRDPALVNKGLVLNQAQYRVVGGDEPSVARQTRTAHPPTAPTAFGATKEALAAVADMGESVMSYSAAQARITQARRESPRSRLWVVPDISGQRGQR